jgi:hypothetical protein
MRSTQYLSAPNPASRILRDAAIVARAISRHRREAALKGRTDEAHEMVALYLGVSEMALGLTQPHQQPAVA